MIYSQISNRKIYGIEIFDNHHHIYISDTSEIMDINDDELKGILLNNLN